MRSFATLLLALALLAPRAAQAQHPTALDAGWLVEPPPAEVPVALPDAAAAARLTGTWNQSFTRGPMTGMVTTLASDGTTLYASGGFGTLGSLVRWDGAALHPMNAPLVGVRAIHASGAEVYASGAIPGTDATLGHLSVARWDGQQWQVLGGTFTGTNGSSASIIAIAVRGAEVYAAGAFEFIGSVPARNIARWDGQQWHALGAGTSSVVRDLAVYNGDLYAGGFFFSAGNVAGTNAVARWDGSAWHSVGGGVASGLVGSLRSDGARLLVARAFPNPVTDPMPDLLLAWDGTSWTSLSSTLPYAPQSSFIAWFDVVGDEIYAHGQFRTNSTETVPNKVARWDGSAWSLLDGDFDGSEHRVQTVGADVYIGGAFLSHGGVPGFDFLGRWDGSTLRPLVLNAGDGLNATVRAVHLEGGDTFVGGNFRAAGGVAGADRIARWDGERWHAVGEGLNGDVQLIRRVGPALLVGGRFTAAGGVAGADYLARWDGQQWHAFAPGLNGHVSAVAQSGSDLYVGGAFSSAGGVAGASGVARWDGQQWHAVGDGLREVLALAVVGTDLYAAGFSLMVVNGQIRRGLARYDGSQWQSVSPQPNGGGGALATDGTRLYLAGGSLTGLGSSAQVVRVEGEQLIPLPTLGTGGASALWINGADLYVGGNFRDPNDASRPAGVARWDGSAWQTVGGGVLGSVFALALAPQTLVVGGGAMAAGPGGVTSLGLGIYTDPQIVSGEAPLDAAAPGLRLALHGVPARHRLAGTLDTPEPARLTLFDVQGRLVLEQADVAGAFALDVSRLAPGIYVLRAEAGAERFARTVAVVR